MAGFATEQGSPLSGLSARERVEHLRKQMASIPARSHDSTPARALVPVIEDEPARGFVATTSEAVRLLPVIPPLAELLPRKGLVRGTVVSVVGARSLLLSLLASVTEAGGNAAIINQPQLGLLAAVEMGADLQKCAMVPNAGPAAVDVAAIVLDGMDLVILGLGGTAVAPTRARGVTARARSKGSVLIVTDGHWDGPDVRIESRILKYGGLTAGRGRVTSIEVEVEVSGRGFRPRIGRMELGAQTGHAERTQWRTVNATPQLLSEAL